MIINFSNKQRASLVGISIIVAYSMLTYSITKSITLGIITDILSGLAVIAIPLLLFPYFNTNKNKRLNYLYLLSRLIEGVLMIIGGILILNPSLESYRELIYTNIHIYFFTLGSLFFYILLHRTQVIPKFISVWGIIATILLLLITVIKLFGLEFPLLNILLLPIILNEIFLAIWLLTKGFIFEMIENK